MSLGQEKVFTLLTWLDPQFRCVPFCLKIFQIPYILVAWFWRLILCKLAFFSDCDQKYLVYNFHSFININVIKLMSILQINGENYLLPNDLKSPSSRADLIHSSLNINWLVKQLSKKYVCIFVSDLSDIFYLNLKFKEEYVSTYITSWQYLKQKKFQIHNNTF